MTGFIIILLLSLVQGLSEFLPISSSGHLYLLYDILGISDNTLLLTIILHIATLCSVIVYYRKELLSLILHPLCPTNRKIIISTIFTLITIIPIYRISQFFITKESLIFSFGITAIILLIADYLSNTRNILSNIIPIYNTSTNIDISYKQAVLIGIAQGVAIIPGISRSGMTISCGIITGVGRDTATKYSFLISIPIIIGSGIMEILDIIITRPTLQFDIMSVVIASIICFIVGLLAIKLCTRIVNKNRLSIFSYYLIILITVIVITMFV